ncbi:MAG: hypothetical protein HW405_804 [Candidatus Berkelbacteria bacterium]|nr:hypothetical protein [Candidatus Berkelbacteria bacterium]
MSEAQETTKDSVKDQEKPKKSKTWCCCLVLIILAILSFLGWRTFVFFGTKSEGTNSNQTTSKITKNYTYHEPSSEAKTRQIDCLSLVVFRITKKNVLCLNLYQTSAEDIKSKLSASSYDRVIVYGEKITFDGNPNSGMTDFAQKFYRVAKFTDQITLPKLMEYYGLENLEYITSEFSPYPAIYYFVDPIDSIMKSCSSDTAATGCGLAHFGLEVNDKVLENETNSVYFLSRPNSSDTIKLEIDKPFSCYTNSTLIHETAHVLTNANESTLSGSQLSLHYVPTWFAETQSELAGALGHDWVCGPGTIKVAECVINGKNAKDCDLIKFNSVFAPVGNHPKFPRDNNCELAMVNEFYNYIGTGDLKTLYSKFFQAVRAQTKVKDLSNDEAFTNFLLDLTNNDQSVKDNLSSHGCSI